ncbi:transposase [Microbacterium paraoxydans]|uniref:transposase n=1 Tax=Microbacterium paraoxydans TaxID=199592 RepID=UPI003F68703F
MWAVLEPLMPVPVGRSRPWTDHRLAVEGMAWKYRTGAPWRDVPERFGKWNSIYKRFARALQAVRGGEPNSQVRAPSGEPMLLLRRPEELHLVPRRGHHGRTPLDRE